MPHVSFGAERFRFTHFWYNVFGDQVSSRNMVTQTLTIGKRRFVLLPERDFRRLQKQAGEGTVHPDVAREAMRELKAYRKTGKAASWKDVKRKLGL